MFNQLVKPATLSELIAIYEQKIRDLNEFIPYYEKVKGFLQEGYQRGHSSISYDKTKDKLKKDAWLSVIEKTQLFSLMSIESANKLKKSFYGDETCESAGIPSFTFDNVTAFIDERQQAMPDMFDEKILEVYKILRPSNYYDLKTNKTSLFEGIGKKVILEWYFERKYSGGLEIRYQKREEINAIQEIFSLLEGKGIPADGEKLYHKLSGAERADAYNDEYFRIKGYNNGNMHLEFKRMDLVRKIVATAKEKLLGKVAA